MELLIGDLLVVPEGGPNLPQISIDLRSIKQAEVRISEIAIVNGLTAPELMATFNKAYLQVTEAIARVTLQYNRTEKEVERRRAVIILDLAKDILTKKGLTNPKSPTGNDDLREAVVNIDEEYIQLIDKLDYLKALMVLLEGKKRAFEQAFTGVRKLLDNRDNNAPIHGTIDQRVGTAVGQAKY